MKPRTKRLGVLAALSASLLVAGCNNNSTSPTPAPTATGNALGTPPYQQLDRLNRPAVNEVFATFAQHDANNRDMPNNDASVIGPQINSFVTNVAGRSGPIASFVAAVLTPDVQIADMSGASQSCIGSTPGTCNNYLGIETGGATQAPSGLKPFGGRALTDDVVSISLSVIFGPTVPAISGGTIADDNREQDGRTDATYPSGKRPNLTTDNVTWQTAPKHFSTTFPYLGTPQ